MERKSSFFDEDVQRQRGRGDLDHAADLHVRVVGRAFVRQALFRALDELQGLVDLGNAGQHRHQDLQVAVGGGAQQRAQLGAEQLRFGQAQADRAQAQRRVAGDAHRALQLLVRAEVEGADGDRQAVHAFHHRRGRPRTALPRRAGRRG